MYSAFDICLELTKMSVGSNNLKKIPEEIEGCSKLQELYLGNNKKLAVIPSTAGHLRFVYLLVIL